MVCNCAFNHCIIASAPITTLSDLCKNATCKNDLFPGLDVGVTDEKSKIPAKEDVDSVCGYFEGVWRETQRVSAMLGSNAMLFLRPLSVVIQQLF